MLFKDFQKLSEDQKRSYIETYKKEWLATRNN